MPMLQASCFVRIAHFATFPPALVKPCIDLGSRPGDFILDPFIGSGTTGLVAYDNNRRFLGVELNPEYVEIAERRLNGRITKPSAGRCGGRSRRLTDRWIDRRIYELYGLSDNEVRVVESAAAPPARDGASL